MKIAAGVRYGIVLKKDKYTPYVALLDKVLGRIDGTSYHGKIVSVGDVVSYTESKMNKKYGMSIGNTEYSPLVLGHYDISFLHHVLEVCYYSIPVGTIETVVFDMIMFLYKYFSPAWSMANKKLFVIRLFLVIGLYVEHGMLYESTINHLCTMPIDKIFSCTIDLDHKKNIDDLLCLLLAEHPYRDQFKTINFLYRE